MLSDKGQELLATLVATILANSGKWAKAEHESLTKGLSDAMVAQKITPSEFAEAMVDYGNVSAVRQRFEAIGFLKGSEIALTARERMIDAKLKEAAAKVKTATK